MADEQWRSAVIDFLNDVAGHSCACSEVKDPASICEACRAVELLHAAEVVRDPVGMGQESGLQTAAVEVVCSFCGKGRKETTVLVKGTGAYICRGCVIQAQGVIDRHLLLGRRAREAKAIAANHRCNRCGEDGGELPTPFERLAGWKGRLCPSCRAQNPDGEYETPPKGV